MTENYISPLDTRRFGFNIARIDDLRVLLAPGFREDLLARQIRLVTTRTAVENIGSINLLEDIGFRVMDVQTTWQMRLSALPEPATPDPELVIGQATHNDSPGIRSIAASAFDNYGHYFNDPRLDKSRCREIYPDWAERSLSVPGVADKVFVARSGEKLAGFLSFKIFEEDGVRYAAGVMGAVDAAYRGKNIFSSLVLEGIRWGMENNLSREEHNSLVSNYPVNRVFARLGFRQAGSFVSLHYWPGP